MIDCDIPNTNEPFLQIKAALSILKKIEAESNSKAIHLSLEKIEWMLPCAVLLLSHKITELKNKGIKFQVIEPRLSNVAAYLRRIGFPLGDTPKGQTFQPIRHFSKNANKEANAMFDVVNNTFPDNEKYREAVFYVLAELSANIDEHAGFNHASMMAQAYQDFIDIGVLDNGISIPAKFEEAGIKFSNDAEAIDMALGGLSTKKEGNRGYGLPTTKKLIENGLKGDIYVVSRMGALVTGHTERQSFYTSNTLLPLKGTFIYLRFQKPQRKLNIYTYLK